MIAVMITGNHPSSTKQIFHNGQPSRYDVRKSFRTFLELLVQNHPCKQQGNYNRKRNLLNIVSIKVYTQTW